MAGAALTGALFLLAQAGCGSDPVGTVRGTGGATAGTGGGSGGVSVSSSGGATPGGGGGTSTGGTVATGTGGAGGTVTAGSGGSMSGGAGNGSAGGAAQGGRGGGAAGSTGGTGVGGSNHTGVWKVMPFGDSVTGSTCYPQVLSRDLIAAGHTNFQFIGTVTNNCGNGTPSVKTEGHGGYGVTYLPSTSTRPRCTKQSQGCGSYAELQTWTAEKPDMLLMHFATNDCWDGQPTATILAAYAAVINEFRKANPNVVVFLSKIIPLAPAPAAVTTLNAALTPAWVTANTTPTSPIHLIDHFAGFNTTTDTVDGVHPNPAGAQKMSAASVKALTAAGYF